MAFFLSLVLITLCGCGIAITWFASYWGIILIILGLLMLTGFKTISADPPNVGLVTVWGKRTGSVKSEGLTFLAPYFPFYYDVIMIKVIKVNKDFTFKNVRCRFEETDKKTKNTIRSGGSVEVVASITWIPNQKSGEELIKFNNSGGESGVNEILNDKMAEEIRQMGRERNWEEMVFATQLMSTHLILSIIGNNVVKNNTEEWTEKFDKITDDSNKYFLPDKLPEKKEDQKAVMNDVFSFLHKAMSNGISDDHDLGIKILRLNIKSVEPEGELKKDAENAAKEAQQRRSEDFELQTEIRQAKILVAKYKSAKQEKSLEQCILEIRRRKLIKDGKGQIFDIAGLPQAEDLINLISKIRR